MVPRGYSEAHKMINSKSVLIVILLLFAVLCLFIYKAELSSNQHSSYGSSQQKDNLTQRMQRMEDKQQMISGLLEELWCKESKVGKTGAFCVSRKQLHIGGNWMWDLGLCQSLEKLFGHSSVLDLGAGLGHYGMCFLRKYKDIFDLGSPEANLKFEQDFEKNMGAYVKQPQTIKSWEGYDGALNIGLITSNFIKTLDLADKGVWIGHRTDWVLSLEVGEHIPAEYMEAFLDNLVRHACKGVAMSWAIPKQGGYHHVNELPNTVIEEKMRARGLVPDTDAQNELRLHVSVYWFKKTLMVFRFTDTNRCK